MNIRKMAVSMAAFLIVAGVCLPDAFAQKEQQKTIDDMNNFREQLVTIKAQIDTVLSSLNGVVQAAGADPAPAYKTFSKEAKKMESQVDKARKMRADMQKRGDALFKEWEKNMGAITNEAIKAKAAANRAQLQQLYGRIQPDLTAMKTSGDSFMSDLKDLQAYFSVDLSSSGIASMSDTVTSCNSDGQTVKGLLDKLLSTLDQVKAQLAPGGTGQPKTK